PRCLYCNNFCYEKQEVEKEYCSWTRSNRVCRCKEDFCCADNFCIRHTECGPGHGVQTKGTSQSNTVCEECAEGFVSNSSCASGQIVLLPGSIYHDTMCGTCEDLGNGGMSRAFLSGFFSMHRMRVAKMCIINLAFFYEPPAPGPVHRGDPHLCQMSTGTHMAAHCTAATVTRCAPCKGELYTEPWNYLPCSICGPVSEIEMYDVL
ncbi:uncharacterized protein LOC121620075, partial [Chelmon rostratus]|uniref:uncharacterized protein LOC121620073 n=1 Tax=Chelmon rostratus TaxID=109905 RepID=UPI001BE762FA